MIAMIKRSLARETTDQIGREVLLFGWVNSVRKHGGVTFIDLRDRSGLVQLVGKKGIRLSSEDVVRVVGRVKRRDPQTVNPRLETGRIEIEIKEIKVLAKTDPLPIEISGPGLEIEEKIRLKYRYLDLRRPRMARNLRFRHKLIKRIRDFLDERDFVEIETPILTKATPEGARDFIVPSRLQPGRFYALPQSPQQYKQLLMVAGFERYYQIARCFRDEDPRADRAYGEFTQLDLEMSFTTQDEILELIEGLMTDLTEKVAGKKILQKPFPRFSYQEAMKRFGDDKFDLRKKKDPDVLAFAWVVDFPLFEKTETRALSPSHHPFTAPKTEDIPLLDKEPMKVRSWQNDLVCNGYEVAGGSIRITDPDVQRKVFQILGHSKKEVETKFGHLLEAFRYGVPPHGGIAVGIDRLTMIFAGEDNLREVIAFPTSSSGRTAVMEAPSEVDKELLKELGIRVASRKR